MDQPATLYANPRTVADIGDCHFYHAMEIPGFGPTPHPQWDLRGREATYLGNLPLAGRRVLEIGPASGHLTFWMESQGAEVVSVELAPDADSDNGNIYALPEALGHFDYAVICSVLLHVRDPLRVFENCAKLADTILVTDMRYPDVSDEHPVMHLFSTPQSVSPDVWWKLSPGLFVRYGEIMGFASNSVTYHEQFWVGDEPHRFATKFTVVSSNRRSAATQSA